MRWRSRARRGPRWITCAASLALAACGSRGPIYDDPWFGRDAALGRAGLDADLDASPPCDWESASEGVRGGGLGALELAPTDPTRRTLFGLSGQRVYRSVDGAGSWELRGELDVAPVGLAFDGDTLLVATEDGVRASRDGGRTFEARGLRGLPVTHIATAPGVPSRVYAAIAGLGVTRSNDGGQTWLPASRGVEGVVHRMSIDPRDPDVVVASTILLDAAGGYSPDGVVLRTTNGGQTWTEIDRLGGRSYDLARCAEDPSVLVAVRRWGMFRSSDGGATFVPMAGAGEQVFFSAAVDGPSCTHVVAFSNTPAAGFGMYVSNDGSHLVGPRTEGFAMSRTARADPVVRAIGGGRIVAGTVSGPFVSDDGGLTYFGGGEFLALFVTTFVENEGVLWAGTYGNGLWSLAPSESRWRRVPVEALDNDYTFSLLPFGAATAERGRVIVGSWGELVGRADGGSRFERIPNDGSPADNVFAFARLPDGTVLSASQIEGIQRSDDGGASFRFSNDGIVPWSTPLGVLADMRAIAVDPARPALVVAGGAGGGIWRSVDAGRTWVASGLAEESVRDLTFAPALGSFSAIVAGEGVFESSDGTAWTDVSSGLESLDVDGLEVADDGTRYAVSGGVVYRRAPSASAWERMPGACAPHDARIPRVVSRADGRWLYVTTGLDGFARLRL